MFAIDIGTFFQRYGQFKPVTVTVLAECGGYCEVNSSLRWKEDKGCICVNCGRFSEHGRQPGTGICYHEKRRKSVSITALI